MKLTEEFLQKYKDKQPEWGYNGLGYITFKRTYARPLENGDTEEWWQTVTRCVNWLWKTQSQMGIEQSQEYYEQLFDDVFHLKASFSGRMLWQAGTNTVDKLGGASMNNCWAVVVDSKEAFLKTFDYLMLGGGVGYNIQQEQVDKLPTVKKTLNIVRQDDASADFIVPDTREGWVGLLDRVLTAFFNGENDFTYSLHCIRGHGEPIKGFGGTASGPEPLNESISKIIEVLNSRAGESLRPIDVLDIMNLIGQMVVAGNVRRSSQIALGDATDKEYMNAKKWSEGIPNHRAMSNNSVVCSNFNELPESFWEGYNGDGEPYGLFNLDLVREKGRLSDDHRSDPEAIATNPCAEITLAPQDGGAESCNLCEIFLNRLENAQEFEDVAARMYKVVKTIALLPYHHEDTQKIITKNLRLGIGVTGVVQAPKLIAAGVLNRVYARLEDEDYKFSKEHGVNQSIKLTTIKPSGTLSLLAGSTPGVHPAYSKHYIRRVRMSRTDSLVQLCKDAGYNIEFVKNFDGSEDHRTVVVEFPIKLDEGVTVAEEMDAIKQLELHKHMQTYWADNQVSVTVYYKKEELPAIREWLAENYDSGVKTVSFLLHNEHGFEQAPYEEISEDKYDDMMSEIKGLKFGKKVEEAVLEEGLECATGGCPVR